MYAVNFLVLWVCWQVGGKVRGWQVGRVEAAPAPHQVSQGGTFDKELVCSRWSGLAWPGGSKLHSSLKSSRRRRSLGGGQACQAAHLCALLHPSHLLHKASTTNDFNNTTCLPWQPRHQPCKPMAIFRPPGYFGSAEFIKSLRRAIFEARGGGRGSKIVLEDGNSGGRPAGASSQSPPSPPAPPAQPGLLSLHLHLLHTTQASNSNFSKLEQSSR